MLCLLIPVYNERESLADFWQKLQTLLPKLTEVVKIIWVDDGSEDGTWKVLNQIYKQNPNLTQAIQFSRHFGAEAAISAGLKASTGKACLILDQHLKREPELMFEFIKHWQQGCAVIYGVAGLKAAWYKRIWLHGLASLVQAAAKFPLPKHSLQCSLLSLKAVDSINQMLEKKSLFTVKRAYIGLKQQSIVIPNGQIPKIAPRNWFLFSSLPLRIFQIFGFLLFVGSSVGIISTLIGSLFYEPTAWTIHFLITAFMASIQLLCLGLLGEYLMRIYNELRPRPAYLVDSHD